MHKWPKGNEYEDRVPNLFGILSDPHSGHHRTEEMQLLTIQPVIFRFTNYECI